MECQMEYMRDHMASDDNTRDIAVAAGTKIDAHVQDCIGYRTETRATLREIQSDIKKIFYVLGGITVLGHIVEIVLGHLK